MRSVLLLALGYSFANLAGFSSEEQFNRAKTETEQLVVRAVDRVKKGSIFTSCEAFVRDPRWQSPHRLLFVIDEKDVCYFFDEKLEFNWHELSALQPISDSPIITSLRIQAQEGGGWVPCLWNSSLVHVFVKSVRQQKKTFLVGAVLVLWSARAQVEAIAHRAVTILTRENRSDAIKLINNPTGECISGSIAARLYDAKGTCLTAPDDISLLGKQIIDFTDDAGNSIFERYKKTVAQDISQEWCEYRLRDTLVKSLVTRLYEPVKQEPQFLVVSYYPERDDSFVKNFLYEAKQKLFTEGPQAAFTFFSQHAAEINRGGLGIEVLNEGGDILASSFMPAVVGTNKLHERDERGYLRTQQIIERSMRNGSAWVVTSFHASPMALYCEKVLHDNTNYIFVVRGYTSSDQKFVAQALSEQLVDHIMQAYHVMQVIKLPHSFMKGCLEIEIFDADGYCLYSDRFPEQVWLASGKFLLTSRKNLGDEGWLEQPAGSEIYRRYVRWVTQDNHERYIVSVGYYA